jgi:hypothetical protein
LEVRLHLHQRRQLMLRLLQRALSLEERPTKVSLEAGISNTLQPTLLANPIVYCYLLLIGWKKSNG